MNTLALFRESIESQKKVEFDEKNGVLRFDGIDIPRNTVISIDGKEVKSDALWFLLKNLQARPGAYIKECQAAGFETVPFVMRKSIMMQIFGKANSGNIQVEHLFVFAEPDEGSDVEMEDAASSSVSGTIVPSRRTQRLAKGKKRVSAGFADIGLELPMKRPKPTPEESDMIEQQAQAFARFLTKLVDEDKSASSTLSSEKGVSEPEKLNLEPFSTLLDHDSVVLKTVRSRENFLVDRSSILKATRGLSRTILENPGERAPQETRSTRKEGYFSDVLERFREIKAAKAELEEDRIMREGSRMDRPSDIHTAGRNAAGSSSSEAGPSGAPTRRASIVAQPKKLKKKREKLGPYLIFIPNALTSPLGFENIRPFLEEGIFKMRSNTSNIGNKEAYLKLTRTAPDGRQAEYHILNNPGKISKDQKLWDNVVAVFTDGKLWQFKGFPSQDPATIFTRYCGFHVFFSEGAPDPTAKSWNVFLLPVSRTPEERPHVAMQAYRDFWKKLDTFMTRKHMWE